MVIKKEKFFGKEEEDKLKESYKQSLRNKKEREKKDDYFDSKSVKQLLDEME